MQTYLLLLVFVLLAFVAGLGLDGSFQYQYERWLAIRFALSAIILAGWYVNATALNDYVDFEIDKINLADSRERPLVSGLAHRHDLILIAIGSGCLALVASAFMSLWLAGGVAILLFFNVAYSFPPCRISRRGNLTPFILPVAYASLPISLGFILSGGLRPTLLALLFYLAFYLHFVARIILKDHRDVVGDRRHGKMTFLLRHGNRAVCLVAAAALTASLIVLLSFFQKYLGYFSYTIVFLGAFAIGILVRLSRIETWSRQKAFLPAFGRVLTGIVAAVMLSFVAYVWRFTVWPAAGSALAVGLVYAWSARHIYCRHIA